MTADTPLARLFAPRSIAVLGASSSADKLGGQVFIRLASSFEGELFAVNQTETAIAGRSAVASLADLPSPVDPSLVRIRAMAATDAANIAISSGFERSLPAELISG